MRLGLIANYSRSLEKSYPRKGATALRRESCPLFAADKLADADYRFGHAKIEVVAALAQTASCCAVGWRRGPGDRANTRRCRRGRREGVIRRIWAQARNARSSISDLLCSQSQWLVSTSIRTSSGAFFCAVGIDRHSVESLPCRAKPTRRTIRRTARTEASTRCAVESITDLGSAHWAATAGVVSGGNKRG